MKKNKISTLKFKFDKKKFFIYFFVSFFLLLTIVAGSTLVGLGFDNFSQFLDFKSYFLTLRPDLTGFDHAWSVYNSLAKTNGWIIANIEMFVIGVVFMVLFLIILITSITLFILKKKRDSSHASFSNIDVYDKSNEKMDLENNVEINKK